MPRKYSGPLMPGKKSAYVKGQRKNKPKGGLNKTEKKQTKKIVESAIKKEYTLKYFDSASNEDAVSPGTSLVGTASDQVSVIAYSSTTEFDDEGAEINYGRTKYQPLYLSRPFKESNASAPLKAQRLNAQYCLPKTARTCFSVERVFYPVPFSTNATPGSAADTARALPISYRIVKFGFKASAGTQNDFDPNTDLFVNSFGQPYGIDSVGFTRLNCKYAPINTKKYHKLMDIQGTLQQNLIVTPNTVGTANTNANFSDIMTGKSGRNLLHMSIPFKLSKRKGGKLFYQLPQDAGTTTSTSGGQREIVAMHFWYDNGHDLLGAAGQPTAPTSTDIQIKTKSTSAFVDAQ